MKGIVTAGLAGVLVMFAGCRGAPPDKVQPLPDEQAWNLGDVRQTLMDLSCPDGMGQGFAMSFLLDVEPVSLGPTEEVAEALHSLEFVGGWALSADLASFGGLSGIKVMPDGSLLTVSDAGALVTLPFDQDGLTPKGSATLTYLTDADGQIISGKASADAEGLEHRDGITLVSFERDHRVAAYAYETCGSNARSVSVARIGSRPETLGHSIRDNSGAEALVLNGGQLKIGLETVIGGLSPVAVIDRKGAPQFAASDWLDADGVPLVGMDELDGDLYSLHRAWNPLSGSTIYLMLRTGGGEAEQLVKLARPLTVDNFEGVAVMRLPDERTRIFLIADDNFSDEQRTLLFAFETVD